MVMRMQKEKIRSGQKGNKRFLGEGGAVVLHLQGESVGPN